MTTLFHLLRPVAAIAILITAGGHADAKMKTKFYPQKKILKISWSGKIKKPMAAELSKAIKNNHARAANGFELILNSGGGKMREGRKVIKLLRRLKETRRLDTTVVAGRKCGSSCIPIYLQGENRAASAATLWLFHEVGKTHPKTKKLVRLKPKRTQQFFRQYFLPAGVPQAWLDKITKRMRGRDVWMTGAQVFSSGSNIINKKLGSTRKRKLHR